MSHLEGREANARPKASQTPLFYNPLGFAAQGYTEVVLHGELNNIDQIKFVAFYLFNDGLGNERVVAAASLNWDPLVAKFADLLKNKSLIDVQMIRYVPFLSAPLSLLVIPSDGVMG